jgi:hypothetical protein
MNTTKDKKSVKKEFFEKLKADMFLFKSEFIKTAKETPALYFKPITWMFSKIKKTCK